MAESVVHIAPWALLTCAATIVLLWALLRAFRQHPAVSLGLVVGVPLLAALGFVVAISGFMFTEQLGWTLVTCTLVAIMLVPGSVLVGQQFARRTLAIEARRAEEHAREVAHRELIAWLSHDLRTPLAGIKAMAEALEDGVVDHPVDVGEYGARISRETSRLGSMVVPDQQRRPRTASRTHRSGRAGQAGSARPGSGGPQPRCRAGRRPAPGGGAGVGKGDGAGRPEPDGERGPAHPGRTAGGGARRQGGTRDLGGCDRRLRGHPRRGSGPRLRRRLPRHDRPLARGVPAQPWRRTWPGDRERPCERTVRARVGAQRRAGLLLHRPPADRAAA